MTFAPENPAAPAVGHVGNRGFAVGRDKFALAAETAPHAGRLLIRRPQKVVRFRPAAGVLFTMSPDAPLLARYVADGDADAFRAWVEQRINLVYSVALRVLNGDRHLAEDVTQQVFAEAARRAAELARHPAPGGWLFTHTRFTAAKLVRSRQRRHHRELTAAMDPSLAPDPPTDWSRVRPELDAALAALPEADRHAVIMRFFEQADYTTIGQHLQLPANTARMRVDRALEKLSAQLRRRGIRSTAAALGTALGAHAVTAAPAGLASTVASTALAAVGAASATLTTAALLTMIKAPLAATAIVIVAGTTFSVMESSVDSPLPPPLRAAAASPPADTARATGTSIPSPTDQDYAALESEVSQLRIRLAELDRAAVNRLQKPPLRGTIHDVNDLDSPPKPMKQAAPNYPVALRNQGTEGRAVISMVIDAQGKVRDLETVSASNDDFAKAALAAVSNWEFAPGTISGTPVNSRLQIPIVFSISRDPAKSPPLHDWF